MKYQLPLHYLYIDCKHHSWHRKYPWILNFPGGNVFNFFKEIRGDVLTVARILYVKEFYQIPFDKLKNLEFLTEMLIARQLIDISKVNIQQYY